jgi:hypothetical protein
LRAQTLELAGRGLRGEFGRTLQNADPALKLQLPNGVSPQMRYARAVALIAQSAPLRILPEEQIVGAATYREAAQHATPILGGSSPGSRVCSRWGIGDSARRSGTGSTGTAWTNGDATC